MPAVGGLGGATGGYNQNGYKGVDGVGRALGGGAEMSGSGSGRNATAGSDTGGDGRDGGSTGSIYGAGGGCRQS